MQECLPQVRLWRGVTRGLKTVGLRDVLPITPKGILSMDLDYQLSVVQLPAHACDYHHVTR